MPKGVYERTPEMQVNIAAANRGREWSPEVRAKMSAAKTGLAATPETRARMSVAHTVHGDTSHGERHSLYSTWAVMKQRCLNPSAQHYDRYGGRGIAVCDEWLEWVPFRDYVAKHLGPRPVGYSLDRIDNDGHYEPGNVRWADRKMQRANQGSQ